MSFRSRGVVRAFRMQLTYLGHRSLPPLFLHRGSPIKRFILIIAVMLIAGHCSADPSKPVENLLLITIDGLRFQELFTGADQRLISKHDGHVENEQVTKEEFWDEDELVRRERLMPFFWNVVAKQGQVFGSPDDDSKVLVENGRYFSYPGYNEILTGIADHSIWSNAKRPNKNVTVLEWLHQKPEFQNRIRAFCSGDVFPLIINEQRSGIPVNAGWEPLATFQTPEDKDSYNQIATELPRYWQGVRYDTFTFRGAMESLKVDRPRLLYVALGATDDWAHAGRYDLHLDSARQNDDFIRRLWEQTQSMDENRDNTALVIATDHGRGDGREGWKNHSNELAGSERIWIAVLAPNVPARGLSKKTDATQGQVAATVAQLLGHEFTQTHEAVAPALLFDQ